jgi:hypothetical protein
MVGKAIRKRWKEQHATKILKVKNKLKPRPPGMPG